MFLRLDSRYQQQDAGLSMPLLMLSLMLATERHVYADKATLRLMLLLISSLFLSSVLMLNFAKVKTVFTKFHMSWIGLMGSIYLQLSFEHWTFFAQFFACFDHQSVIKSKRFSTKYRSCESLTSKKQELDVLSKLQNLQFSSTSHSTCTQRTLNST